MTKPQNYKMSKVEVFYYKKFIINILISLEIRVARNYRKPAHIETNLEYLNPNMTYHTYFKLLTWANIASFC